MSSGRGVCESRAGYRIRRQRISAAGRRSRPAVPCRTGSSRRWRRLPASRSRRSVPAAPMPACMRSRRWCILIPRRCVRESAWVRGVNALLPAALAVTWAQPVVDERFHARYSALGAPLPLCAVQSCGAAGRWTGVRVGWFHLPLDLDAMRAAAQRLIGEHDFSAFRSAECQARSPGAAIAPPRHRTPRRLRGFRLVRQRLPASHGAQYRWLPGIRRQGQTSAAVAGARCWPAAIARGRRRRSMPPASTRARRL